MEYKKINVLAFSIAVGIAYGLAVLYLVVHYSITGFGEEFLRLYEILHPGISIIGAKTVGKRFLAGGIDVVWAFVDGAIFGAIVSWFYNLFTPRASSSETSSEETKNNNEEEKADEEAE